ncbi:his Kinase A domain protein, partial [Vibrio parahaemolyticus EKP-008]
SNQ